MQSIQPFLDFGSHLLTDWLVLEGKINIFGFSLLALDVCFFGICVFLELLSGGDIGGIDD